MPLAGRGLGARRWSVRLTRPLSMMSEPAAELAHMSQESGTAALAALPKRITAAEKSTATTTLRAARCFSSEAKASPHRIIDAPSVKRSAQESAKAAPQGS